MTGGSGDENGQQNVRLVFILFLYSLIITEKLFVDCPPRQLDFYVEFRSNREWIPFQQFIVILNPSSHSFP